MYHCRRIRTLITGEVIAAAEKIGGATFQLALHACSRIITDEVVAARFIFPSTITASEVFELPQMIVGFDSGVLPVTKLASLVAWLEKDGGASG